MRKCVDVSVCMCARDRQRQGGVDRTEGQEGGRKSETEGERQQVRDTEGFLESEEEKETGLLCFSAEACSYRQTSFIHIPTLQTDSLSKQLKRTEYGGI